MTAQRTQPSSINLGDAGSIPILYEDRAVLAIDKPPGWLLAPASWDRTSRNLHLALQSSIAAGDFWARARHLKYLRFVHRLDQEASGVLLCAKHPGVMAALSRLFESRRMVKTYLAVVQGTPPESEWSCHWRLGLHRRARGRVVVNPQGGKEAETRFQAVQSVGGKTLVRAWPRTGRTHQIRVHLAAAGYPILNDSLYGAAPSDPAVGRYRLALRAIALAYDDPFRKRRVEINASFLEFVHEFGFNLEAIEPSSEFTWLPKRELERKDHHGRAPGRFAQ